LLPTQLLSSGEMEYHRAAQLRPIAPNAAQQHMASQCRTGIRLKPSGSHTAASDDAACFHIDAIDRSGWPPLGARRQRGMRTSISLEATVYTLGTPRIATDNRAISVSLRHFTLHIISACSRLRRPR